MWFKRRRPKVSRAELAEACRTWGHVPTTGWAGYWDVCQRCHRRFVPPAPTA